MRDNRAMIRAWVFLLAWCGWAADADLILHNGKVVTVDPQSSIRQAVAVKGGRITAVGTDAAVLKERGPGRGWSI